MVMDARKVSTSSLLFITSWCRTYGTGLWHYSQALCQRWQFKASKENDCRTGSTILRLNVALNVVHPVPARFELELALLRQSDLHISAGSDANCWRQSMTAS